MRATLPADISSPPPVVPPLQHHRVAPCSLPGAAPILQLLHPLQAGPRLPGHLEGLPGRVHHTGQGLASRQLIDRLPIGRLLTGEACLPVRYSADTSCRLLID